MRKFIKWSVLFLSLVNMQFALAANGPSVAGRWKTISDVTGKPRSIMVLSVNNGQLTGRIVKVFKQPGDTGICSKCPGRFKDKPIKNMQIMWGLRQQGTHMWSGGSILDPKTGKIYSCKITVAPDGRTMQVRGYRGVSLFGRTQTWQRL